MDVEMKNPFSLEQWIAWVGATVVAVAATVSMAYSTFETKENSVRNQETIEKRLDRMENKIDILLAGDK